MPKNAIDVENVYISGDNLDGLKHLLKSYAGQVKCIYIDPPYNTGSDGFVYNDKFNFTVEDLVEKLSIDEEQAQRILDLTNRGSASHSAWLMFMYPRLQLSRDLLAKDGVIFISIDDNEQSNLKLICDDVFGEQNFAGQIAIVNNLKGRNDRANIATTHEYLLMYVSENFVAGGLPLTEEQKKEYKYVDENGNQYSLRDLRKRGRPDRREDRPNMYFPIYYNEETKELSMTSKPGYIKIVPLRGDGSDGRWRWGKDHVSSSLQILHPEKNNKGNSKLQEVGRGLRLPVDENGNRISNEEFKLNYIVDFTEADFAEKLVDEINCELPETLTLSQEALDRVAKERGVDPDDLFIELMSKKYINRNYEIRTENRDAFYADYLEFATGVGSNKVTDVNKNKKEVIHVRKAVYSELKELWERINHKYYLFYDVDLTDEIPQALHDILRKVGTFGNVTLYSHRDQVAEEGNAMVVREDTGVSYSIKRPIPYNEFLKRISQQTSIPITEIHKAMCELSKEKDIPNEYINEYSLANIVSAFKDWHIEKMQTRFKYTRSTQPVAETALTYKDGTPRDVIKQGNVGTKFAEGTPSDKYLYDKIVFDSPLEKANIMTDIDEVVVYGKIPKSSVAIPTIVGENYSPDFMYVVKHKDGTKELNIVVETKLVENKSTLRGIEDAKIKCAEAFFKQLTIDGYTVSFHTQLSNKKVKQIIEDVIAG